MRSEVSQTEKDQRRHMLSFVSESRSQTSEPTLKNKLMNTKNKLVVARGVVGRGMGRG